MGGVGKGGGISHICQNTVYHTFILQSYLYTDAVSKIKRSIP